MILAPALGVVARHRRGNRRSERLEAEVATERREELRDALSDFLDLVVMSMEGGRSHADALPTVAQIGTGWSFHTLHDAIDNARPNGLTPWEALGESSAIATASGELIDLRAALNLAQDEGTSDPQHVSSARAQSMRDARLATAYARANKSTDAMRNNVDGDGSGRCLLRHLGPRLVPVHRIATTQHPTNQLASEKGHLLMNEFNQPDRWPIEYWQARWECARRDERGAGAPEYLVLLLGILAHRCSGDRRSTNVRDEQGQRAQRPVGRPTRLRPALIREGQI
jgi:hypothetical protein